MWVSVGECDLFLAGCGGACDNVGAQFITTQQKTLGKTRYLTKPFRLSKIFDTKRFERIIKFMNYFPSVNLSLGC